MASETRPRTETPTAAWERFKQVHGDVLGRWVEAERALALALRDGGNHPVTGDRLLAAEAALQAAIIDFATSDSAAPDPVPVALELLRLAEKELFENPPDLRAIDGVADRRREGRVSIQADRRRSHPRDAADAADAASA
ncbi:MAG: hypothetical protein QOE92_1644 [Chloroflexota bacterium]|jgi:hypothetical protein|nr:hypothetical protein [Chloroflexota bacterium]